MKPFRFRLERLRRVRAIEEQTARALWAAAEAAAREEEERLAAQRDSLAATRAPRPLGASAGEEVAGRELSLERTEAVLLHGLLERRESFLTLRGQADRQRAAWVDHSIQVKALEELERRGRARHRKAEERDAQREADELALLRQLAERKGKGFQSRGNPGR